MSTRFKSLAAVACLAIVFSAAVSVSAQEDAHTVMKFWAVTDKAVGATYNERIDIINISSEVLAAGTLVIELPSSLQLVSNNSVSVPAIGVGGSYSTTITVKAVNEDMFAIIAASYFVGGERFGFMSAPTNITATGAVLGAIDDAGGAADAEALPRTGSPIGPAYFTAALLLMSWGLVRSKLTW